jgi:hypothetical protein
MTIQKTIFVFTKSNRAFSSKDQEYSKNGNKDGWYSQGHISTVSNNKEYIAVQLKKYHSKMSPPSNHSIKISTIDHKSSG